MAEEPNGEQLAHRLFEQINQHLETRWKYLMLNAGERTSAAASQMAGGMVLFVFALLVLFFFSMGFAWWLGDVLQHRAGGFALAGLIFVPIAYGVFRWIRPFVRDKVIEAFLHEDQPSNHPDGQAG